MKKILFLVSSIIYLLNISALAQKTCTSNPTTIGSNINFGSISWTASGGATAAECNNMADGLITFTGNVIVDLANNTEITITNDVNITGNFPISGGPGSLLSVDGGYKLYVTGNLGDAGNNGVQYEVVSATDEIQVDGTLYGKNTNAFTGNGTISGGTLDVKNGSTCGTPCPVTGGFSNCNSGDSFCTNNNVTLPVVMLFFDGSPAKTSNGVELTWATSMEENFQKFVVQKSYKGKEFEDIGEVPGQGRNLFDIISNYSFEDKMPFLGFNYYRLKAVDLDGSFEIFGPVAVQIQGLKDLWIYPNPASNSEISYKTNFEEDAVVTISILNQLGEEIASVQKKSGSQLITLQNSLPTGVYFLKYEMHSFHKLEKFFVK